MQLFFTECFADGMSDIEVETSTANQSSQPEVISSLMNFAPLIIIFAIFYFLIIRPQQKKVKAHGKMLSSVKRGDKVTTVGGLIGVVTKIDTTNLTLTIEIADGIEVKVLRSSVAEIMNKSGNDKKQ